ncbi:MAG: DUF4386 domain-containing protein [Bacteroidetes bacterium]|nr:MAG: DUF4386 domain-containing protein [Bacteroidota bacterium]
MESQIRETGKIENYRSFRFLALFAGIGYLIIFVSGIFANFFVLETMIFPGDAVATAENILTDPGQFLTGIISFVFMVVFDVLLAWALYLLLKPVNENLSLLSGWLRLVNGTIFSIALFNLFDVSLLLSGEKYLEVFQPDQLYAQVMLKLEAFNSGWLIGLVFFGVHLLVLGYLIIKSGFVPRFIGYLLLVAGAGYLIDSFAQFTMANYEDYANVFMLIVVVPGVIGELSLTIWLLIKGIRRRQE